MLETMESENLDLFAKKDILYGKKPKKQSRFSSLMDHWTFGT